MSHFTHHSFHSSAAVNTRICRAEVIFGTPSKNCDGVGICHISGIDHVRVRRKCPAFAGWLQVEPSGAVKMTFSTETLSAEVMHRCFRGDWFAIEEPYDFPQPVISALGLGQYRVKAGFYPVEVSDFHVSIIL